MCSSDLKTNTDLKNNYNNNKKIDTYYNLRSKLNADANIHVNSNGIYKHTLDYSIKHCIEMYKSAITNLKKKNISNTTIARRISSVKVFFGFLVKKNYIKTNPTLKLITPKLSKVLPNVLGQKQAEQLLNQAANFEVEQETQEVRIRDYAILEVLYSTGIRVSELVGMNIEDINFSNLTLKVLGKGRKERVVPFGFPAKDALNNYLNQSRNKFIKNESEALFLGQRGNRLNVRQVRRKIGRAHV